MNYCNSQLLFGKCLTHKELFQQINTDYTQMSDYKSKIYSKIIRSNMCCKNSWSDLLN